MSTQVNGDYGQIWECVGCRLIAEWHAEGGYYSHCRCRYPDNQLRFLGYEEGYGPDGKLQTSTEEEPGARRDRERQD